MSSARRLAVHSRRTGWPVHRRASLRTSRSPLTSPLVLSGATPRSGDSCERKTWRQRPRSLQRCCRRWRRRACACRSRSSGRSARPPRASQKCTRPMRTTPTTSSGSNTSSSGVSVTRAARAMRAPSHEMAGRCFRCSTGATASRSRRRAASTRRRSQRLRESGSATRACSRPRARRNPSARACCASSSPRAAAATGMLSTRSWCSKAAEPPTPCVAGTATSGVCTPR
mmetsp:Transcript_34875/g.76716  ORF Transcript_34875/g.76716 Transcript_34875/m.76716 type:complete len:228 (-) Transcript_34875:751-1434(-)